MMSHKTPRKLVVDLRFNIAGYIKGCVAYAIACLLALSLVAPLEASEIKSELRECPPGLETLNATCGVVFVPENRAEPSKKTIEIYFVKLHAKSSPTMTPVFVLAGGPGFSSSDGAVDGERIFGNELKTRDVVYVDVRGTGNSNRLDCPYIGPANKLQIFMQTPIESENLSHCLKILSVRADLSQYTTTNITHDLDAVRQSLGYEKISFFGYSYGTRAAFVYTHFYPEYVQSAVLIGPFPTNVTLIEYAPQTAQKLFLMLTEKCSSSSGCVYSNANFAVALENAIEKFKEGALPVILVNPDTGLEENVLLDKDDLLLTLWRSLYSVESAANLPNFISDINAGDLTGLAEAVIRRGKFSGGSAWGMHLSVTCTDDINHLDQEYAAALARDTYLGELHIRARNAACSVWPGGEKPTYYKRPVRSDVPILLIVGELDNATPPWYARRAAETLSNAQIVEIPGESHIFTSAIIPCLRKIRSAFFENESINSADRSCVRPDG